jgi:hypothetical protein
MEQTPENVVVDVNVSFQIENISEIGRPFSTP